VVDARAMIIETRAVPPFQKNGYVVACEETSEAVVIDPGDEVDMLLDIVKAQSLSVQSILLTHAHVDHVTGVRSAKDALRAPVFLHRDDQFLYDAAPQQAAFFGLHCDALPAIDHHYDLSKTLSVGEYEIGVYHTPGHCPGGVCLAIGRKGSKQEELFVGDTLFAGSIGRTDLPGGDHPTLIRSITEVLFAFGDAARVYSGHGPQTTIGRERRTNPFLRSA
jgi:glyoxylase-like metal-dependent hydrolase (beta-lactamase superfamily II)